MTECVRIERDIQLTRSQYEHIMNIIQCKQLFVSMKSFKNSIVAKYFNAAMGEMEEIGEIGEIGEMEEILCIRNVIDPNDETLQCVSFTHSVVDGNVLCRFHDIDLDALIENGTLDEDVFIDKFVFETITLSITENSMVFEMKYNKYDHPQYISKMFSQFFDKMLEEYIAEIKLQVV